MSSMPTERRTSSGVTPVSACSATVSCAWVVEAGWMISDFESPMLARCEKSLTELMSFLPASNALPLEPPLMPKVTSAPLPPGRYFCGAREVLARLEAGIVDPLDAGVRLEMRGHGQRVLRVALHAQMQRLHALQQKEGIERRERRACTT